MKKPILISSILAIFFTCIVTHAAWFNSYSNAIKTAQRKNLPILADVSGKNWCIWCKRLDKEVFNTHKFKEFAKKNLVLLLIDVPNPRSPSKEAKLFMKKFPVRGYPTVYLIDKNGKVLYKTGYLGGGPENYIKSLKPYIKIKPAFKKTIRHSPPKNQVAEQKPQNNISPKLEKIIFVQGKKFNFEFIKNFRPDINPYIFLPMVFIMAIFGFCSFICLIISFVRMFQNRKIAIGLICIFLSIFSGIGPVIAFIYSWVKVSEFGTNKLMRFWTFCILINIILSIIFIWQCFSKILS
jgi:thioredoxin-related protein